MGREARRLLPPLWPKDCVGVPMSASSHDMCDLYRAEMALEHAWQALDRARRALPVRSDDRVIAKAARQATLECFYLGSLAFMHKRFIHNFMLEQHGWRCDENSR